MFFGLFGSGWWPTGGGGRAFDLPNLIPTHERGKWTLEREFIHRFNPDNGRGGIELRRDTPRTDTATNYDTILKDLYFALVPLASMDDGSLPLKRGFNYYDEIRLDANFCF